MEKTAMELLGKVALVTGGSRGIGAEIVRRLAADGADVALTYATSREPAERLVDELERMGRRGLALAADSADPQAVVSAVDQTAEKLGRLDTLVNNAGINNRTPTLELTLPDLDQLLDVNVRAVFLATQAAARHLGSGGRIINIGSTVGERVPAPGMTAYAMTKSALVGLAKGFARDLGPRGITVNTVAPGPIDTDMNPATAARADIQRSWTVTGEYATPADVASLVAFLAGQGGRNITGATLLVDGGWAA